MNCWLLQVVAVVLHTTALVEQEVGFKRNIQQRLINLLFMDLEVRKQQVECRLIIYCVLIQFQDKQELLWLEAMEQTTLLMETQGEAEAAMGILAAVAVAVMMVVLVLAPQAEAEAAIYVQFVRAFLEIH
jgi:hypothetical protein